jgi:alkylation response protein AidB-like acyl-CoA dehydrogenase
MLVATVRVFIGRDVKPSVREVEHANAHPEAWIEQTKRIGIYCLAIPEEYGASPVSMPCYVRVTQELARGWMSLAGAMGGPRINGSNTWICNARRSGLIALLCKTDPHARPRHKGISIVLAEHGPGLAVSRDLPKLGYKGVESCELSFDDFAVPRGPWASRPRRSRTRRPMPSSGKASASRSGNISPSAHPLCRGALRHGGRDGQAVRLRGRGGVALNAVRIHGGYGYSTEYDVERYFRDAPPMIVGEGTNEIQRHVIAAQLVARGGI